MPVATALTAVGPSYIFPIIAALADAGVTQGLPPHVALPAVTFAMQQDTYVEITIPRCNRSRL